MFKNIRRNLAYWTEESVEPEIGSVVFCKLAGNAEHTGVFIGHLGEDDKCIVELRGNGDVSLVTPQEFLDGPSGIRLTGIAIYVSCDENGCSLRNYQVAELAKAKINSQRDYNLLVDNCHQFTCGCLSGDFENSSNFFWMMEEDVKKYLNQGYDITWRNWDFESYISKILKGKSEEEASEAAADKYDLELQAIENNPNLNFNEKHDLKTKIRQNQSKELMEKYRENRRKMRKLF
jgi:hypothetical protein